MRMKNKECKKVEKIWKENEKIADELANCYYDSILNEYKDYIEKTSKENFGFNVFSEGIRLGLDITIPIADENTRKTIKEKINSMIKYRTKVRNKEKVTFKMKKIIKDSLK